MPIRGRSRWRGQTWLPGAATHFSSLVDHAAAAELRASPECRGRRRGALRCRAEGKQGHRAACAHAVEQDGGSTTADPSDGAREGALQERASNCQVLLSFSSSS
eukprot:scaffold180_cov311-Pinguiococcus_pyrenoidosus.AAC.27